MESSFVPFVQRQRLYLPSSSNRAVLQWHTGAGTRGPQTWDDVIKIIRNCRSIWVSLPVSDERLRRSFK